jgi:formate/nitrite transporter FocA (FNT family)
MIAVTEKKTLAYAQLGIKGLWIAFVKAILCNWMVTLGSFLAFASRDTTGKVVAMWLPIFTFFALGFEHSVVNLFLIPAGILMGAPVSIADWWLWNQIPVTLGNIVGGALFTAGALYWTYSSPAQKP